MRVGERRQKRGKMRKRGRKVNEGDNEEHEEHALLQFPVSRFTFSFTPLILFHLFLLFKS